MLRFFFFFSPVFLSCAFLCSCFCASQSNLRSPDFLGRVVSFPRCGIVRYEAEHSLTIYAGLRSREGPLACVCVRSLGFVPRAVRHGALGAHSATPCRLESPGNTFFSSLSCVHSNEPRSSFYFFHVPVVVREPILAIYALPRIRPCCWRELYPFLFVCCFVRGEDAVGMN